MSVSVTISNSGNYDGHEIAQLYVHDKVGSLTRPVKELKGFKKIFLKKGESKTVKFQLTIDDLKFFNGQEYTVEAGEFNIAIAGNSDISFTNSFKLKL